MNKKYDVAVVIGRFQPVHNAHVEMLRRAGGDYVAGELDPVKFAELIVQECIDKIETYRIPVGNSPAGELACEWTYDALKDIRDDIKETFGIAK
jgi:hypothetical protein